MKMLYFSFKKNFFIFYINKNKVNFKSHSHTHAETVDCKLK